MSLTVGEHDTMWKDVMGTRIPLIEQHLRDANALSCLVMLKSAGVITDSCYKKSIEMILENCGYKLAPEDYKQKITEP